MERIVGILKFMKVVYPHQTDMDITVRGTKACHKSECRVNG